MTGDSASQTNSTTGPDQTLADDSMVQEIRNHKKKLEEISGKLRPSERSEVLGATVETFRRDILSILTFIDNIESTMDLFTYIPDPDKLYKKLDDIISAFDDALDAWKMSTKGDIIEEELRARSLYRKHLKTCYELLKQALKEFNPIEQPQQGGTNSEGNTELMRKTP